MKYPEPPRKGKTESHDLEPDPPAGPILAVLRWKCRDCGQSVTDFPRGIIHGDAVTEPCIDHQS